MSTKKISCASCSCKDLLGPFRISRQVHVFVGVFDRVIPEAYVCPVCGHLQLQVAEEYLDKLKKYHDKLLNR